MADWITDFARAVSVPAMGVRGAAGYLITEKCVHLPRNKVDPDYILFPRVASTP